MDNEQLVQIRNDYLKLQDELKAARAVNAQSRQDLEASKLETAAAEAAADELKELKGAAEARAEAAQIRVKGLEIQVQEMRGLLANKGDEIVATRATSVKLAQMYTDKFKSLVEQRDMMCSLIKKQRPDLSSEIDRMVLESENNFKTPAGPEKQPTETSSYSQSNIRSVDQQASVGPSDSEMLESQLDSPLAKKQIDFDKPRPCKMQLDHHNTQSDAAIVFDLLRSMDCSAVKLVNFVSGEVLECHPEVVEKYFPSLNSSQIETLTSDNEAWVQWLERVKEVNDFCQSEDAPTSDAAYISSPNADQVK